MQTALPTKLIDQLREKFEFQRQKFENSETFGAGDTSQNLSESKLQTSQIAGVESESSQARRGRAMRQASYKGLFKQASVNSGCHHLEGGDHPQN